MVEEYEKPVDVVEAIQDDTKHRSQAWKPHEEDYMRRMADAAEEQVRALKRIADALEYQAGLGEEAGGGEGQPKAK